MEYYIKSTGEDIAVFNSATNILLWYVQGEVKFPHHSTPDFSANNSNTGATSYTTDPFLIALNQTNSYLYPDMEYKLTDHLGSTRMSYKLNFTCAGVYQNATINYMADYFSFGKIVREYINAGTAAEKYQYTGKERDTESGYDNFNARNYHSEVGRFLSVDPLADKYPGWSSYNYTMNNPMNMVDPDGMEADDIIIRAKRGDDKNYVKRTFDQLQSLTSQKLQIDKSGNVTIVNNEGGNASAHSESTKLVADLIGDHSKTTTITNDVGAISKGIKETDLYNNSFTFPINNVNASNGKGTGSNILHIPDVKAKMAMEDGSKQNAEPLRVLQHELIHADNNRTGSRASLENPNKKPSQEEVYTRRRENSMNIIQRKEE